uniref:Uncharacterized protein n=1 Tax=Anguilla anguilla TaxID=7936 RepID=A0A0E9PK40_ANGAN
MKKKRKEVKMPVPHF